jgi:hypothetical protein
MKERGESMPLWLKILVVIIIVFSASSFVWFLLGSTAYFQRGMDIIGTTYLVGVAVPVFIFVVLFTTLLIKGWNPTSGEQYTLITFALIISVLLSAALIQSVNTQGWAKEKIISGTLKTSADEKYEYRIDLINLFQRNSHARLYLRDVSTGQETYIPTDIQLQKIKGLAVGKDHYWVKLEPTDNEALYILSTTKELPIPEEKFNINIKAGTASRLK